MGPKEAAVSFRRLVLLFGGLVALVKVAYLLEYTTLPFLGAPLYDSEVYVHQARQILAGRFDDPALLAFSPLYGWFLALLGGGENLLLPVLAQLVLGALNLTLLYRLAARELGRAAAFVSVALHLGYGLLLFYETKLLSETLGLTLALSAWLLFTSPGYERARWRTAIGCGVLAGLAILARASLLFAAPILAACSLLAWTDPDARSWAARGRRTAGLALGLCLVLGGNGLWNLAHSGFFVPVTFVPETLATASTARWQGDLRVFGRGARRAVGPWDVVRSAEDRMAGRSPGRARTRVDVVGILRGAPDKIRRTFSDTETTFQYGYYGERTEIGMLGALPVSFGMLLLLGGVGAFFLVRRDGVRGAWKYLPYLVAPVVTAMLFHPGSRYRLPMVLPLLVLAGHGLVSACRVPNRTRRIATLSVLGLACGFFALGTITYELRSPATWELRVAEGAARVGDVEETRRRIDRAHELAPDDPDVAARIDYVQGWIRSLPPSGPEPPR